MEAKHKILVIEDEALVLDAIRRKLESSGYEVVTAVDGKSGLDAALTVHPDLILLDIVLPMMDGVSVLEQLRNDSWGAKVPVIILSNLNDASSIEESKKKGVHNYLVKTDWKLEDVVEKVKNSLA